MPHGNFLDPLAVWSSLGLLRVQQRLPGSDGEHLPWLFSPIGGWRETLKKNGRLLSWRERLRVSQSALQEEERFIDGLVHGAAERLGQTKCPSLARAHSSQLCFRFQHKGILLSCWSGCNGYRSSTHSCLSSHSLEQHRKSIRKAK